MARLRLLVELATRDVVAELRRSRVEPTLHAAVVRRLQVLTSAIQAVDDGDAQLRHGRASSLTVCQDIVDAIVHDAVDIGVPRCVNRDLESRCVRLTMELERRQLALDQRDAEIKALVAMLDRKDTASSQLLSSYFREVFELRKDLATANILGHSRIGLLPAALTSENVTARSSGGSAPSTCPPSPRSATLSDGVLMQTHTTAAAAASASGAAASIVPHSSFTGGSASSATWPPLNTKAIFDYETYTRLSGSDITVLAKRITELEAASDAQLARHEAEKAAIVDHNQQQLAAKQRQIDALSAVKEGMSQCIMKMRDLVRAERQRFDDMKDFARRSLAALQGHLHDTTASATAALSEVACQHVTAVRYMEAAAALMISQVSDRSADESEAFSRGRFQLALAPDPYGSDTDAMLRAKLFWRRHDAPARTLAALVAVRKAHAKAEELARRLGILSAFAVEPAGGDAPAVSAGESDRVSTKPATREQPPVAGGHTAAPPHPSTKPPDPSPHHAPQAPHTSLPSHASGTAPSTNRSPRGAGKKGALRDSLNVAALRSLGLAAHLATDLRFIQACFDAGKCDTFQMSEAERRAILDFERRITEARRHRVRQTFQLVQARIHRCRAHQFWTERLKKETPAAAIEAPSAPQPLEEVVAQDSTSTRMGEEGRGAAVGSVLSAAGQPSLTQVTPSPATDTALNHPATRSQGLLVVDATDVDQVFQDFLVRLQESNIQLSAKLSSLRTEMLCYLSEDLQRRIRTGDSVAAVNFSSNGGEPPVDLAANMHVAAAATGSATSNHLRSARGTGANAPRWPSASSSRGRRVPGDAPPTAAREDVDPEALMLLGHLRQAALEGFAGEDFLRVDHIEPRSRYLPTMGGIGTPGLKERSLQLLQRLPQEASSADPFRVARQGSARPHGPPAAAVLVVPRPPLSSMTVPGIQPPAGSRPRVHSGGASRHHQAEGGVSSAGHRRSRAPVGPAA